MPDLTPKNSFGARAVFETGSGPAYYYRLEKLAEDGLGDVGRLPFSIKVLLESLLRNENGYDVTADDVRRLAAYDPSAPAEFEVPFKPARVVLQDFTGVPAVVDLAALRSAMQRMGGDPQAINPLVPVDLVIDHSVQVDEYDSPLALVHNAAIEFERNRERYEFLRWGQQAFANFKVVPPASGIVHQVNLEYLSRGVEHRPHGDHDVVFPDSLVGTDSHTTMINGLGVVGWGVGGIEAEAVMLGQPIYMLAPEVVGFKLIGRLPEGSTATDLALVVTQQLRKHGVVGKFVEFFGPGLAAMTLPDRATIANMAPEYGATMGFFPTDAETLRYLTPTRSSASSGTRAPTASSATKRRPTRSSRRSSSSTSPPSNRVSRGPSARRTGSCCARCRPPGGPTCASPWPNAASSSTTRPWPAPAASRWRTGASTGCATATS